jgi:hypothetical protein
MLVDINNQSDEPKSSGAHAGEPHALPLACTSGTKKENKSPERLGACVEHRNAARAAAIARLGF